MNTPAQQQHRLTRGTTSDRILRLLADYHPLPLTVDDFADELASPRSTIHTVVGQLVHANRIRRESIRTYEPGPGVSHFWLANEPQSPDGNSIVLHVTPMGKPRMTQQDKWKKRDVVVRYRALANELKFKTKGFPLSDALDLHFVLPMPASWTKKKRAELLGQPHQQKPDTDNLVKAILDALYADDSTVHTVNARKTWGVTGSITITNLEETNA